MTLLVTARGATDVGKIREKNEDSHLVALKCGLFIVADGMGGHDHGEVASQIAIEDISGVASAADEICRMYEQTPGYVLRLAFLGAHQRIQKVQIEKAKDHHFGRPSNMGTTAVAALLMGQRLTIGNTGDSRAYLFRAGRLIQLTYDHSRFNELIAEDPGMDEQSRADLANKVSNIITQHLGMDGWPAVDITAVDLRRGDTLMLCSDGLTDLVSDRRIRVILGAESDLETCCDTLIALANGAGGKDNITVVIARFTGDELPELSRNDPLITYESCKRLAATPQP